jgi:hypothetical protein
MLLRIIYVDLLMYITKYLNLYIVIVINAPSRARTYDLPLNRRMQTTDCAIRADSTPIMVRIEYMS